MIDPLKAYKDLVKRGVSKSRREPRVQSELSCAKEKHAILRLLYPKSLNTPPIFYLYFIYILLRVDHIVYKKYIMYPQTQIFKESFSPGPPFPRGNSKGYHNVYHTIWVSENSVPLNPMVNDHYPY